MLKKDIWKYVLQGFLWLISLGGLVFLMSFIEIRKSASVCTKVEVIIPGTAFFIDKEEVDKIIGLNSNALIGRKLNTINIHQLEKRLQANPFVEYAKVYTDMDGVIVVEIIQRRPLMRMMNRFDQDFYIDQHGLKMPMSENFTAKLPVASGYIDELFSNRVDTLSTPLAKNLFKTASFIVKDSLWNAQITQIYVNEQREIELVPRVGNQRILLGTADSIETKFKNLAAFYKQAIPTVGWDAYTVINIKYANQVIGVKNDNRKPVLDTAAINAAKKDTIKTSIKDTSIIKH